MKRLDSGVRDGAVDPAVEDDEADEMYLALKSLLTAMNQSKGRSIHQEPECAVMNDKPSERLSHEEMLENRRQEREQLRQFILSGGRSGSTGGRCNSTCLTADDEDDEESGVSVESTISNRLRTGSFSCFHMQVISRDRWATEEKERLPVVWLPRNARYASPADNPKINVYFTNEVSGLHNSLKTLKARHLTPPKSTWSMQMRDFDPVVC